MSFLFAVDGAAFGEEMNTNQVLGQAEKDQSMS